MPGQQRLRPHREGVPGAARQHPAACRQQQPVVWLKPWPVELAAKNREFMAEHENLQLLGSVTAGDEHDQLQQAADDDVED
jgi:hypothetical protein